MVLASRGQRENDDGSQEAIGDAALVAALGTVARSVWVRTVVATAIGGAVLALLPHPL